MDTALPLEGLNVWAALLLMLACIGIVAFFSSSEASLISINKYKIRNLRETGNRKAATIERILKNHGRFFSTILTLENLCIILASSLGTTLALQWFGSSGIAMATLVLTVFIVIMGEITPKTYAAQNAEKYALRVARPMEIIIKLFNPIIAGFTWVANGILKLAGGAGKVYSPMEREEIKTMISLGVEDGVIASPEREILEGVFSFADTLAKEVMVPRVEIIAVPADAGFQAVHQAIAVYGHSRLPVYEGNIDNIIGVVYAKDIIQYEASHKTELDARQMMRPPFFAPGSKKIIELLSDLQTHKTSMAIILDEFGGTDGLLTIETLLEEIVGEIEDEFDLTPPEIEELGASKWLADARINVEDINDRLDLHLPLGPYQTLGGFIINAMGKIPKRGEVFAYDGTRFVIELVERCKLRRIRIEQ